MTNPEDALQLRGLFLIEKKHNYFVQAVYLKSPVPTLWVRLEPFPTSKNYAKLSILI